MVENLPARQDPWVGRILWRRDHQYSGLGNFMNRGTWQNTVHGVAKELDTAEQFSLLLFSILVWEITLIKEPGGLKFMGLQKNKTELGD